MEFLIQIAVYGEYIYLAGGGGGSTGIPNEIVRLTSCRKYSIK